MNLEQFFVPYRAHRLLPGRRLLVLAPHPDDEVFGCGATLSQMASADVEIQVIILTDGVLAGEWSDAPAAEARVLRRQKIGRRRAESKAAALRLGYGEPHFMGWGDGELLSDGSGEGCARSEKCLSELVGWVERYQPDLLLAPSVWEMHRDHRAAAQWALRLLEGAAMRLAFYEVGVPLLPNYLVDISETRMRKDEAMGCFASQLAEQAYADQVRGLNVYRSYTLGMGVASAEAFHLLSEGELAGFQGQYQPDYHSLALLNAEKALQAGLPALQPLRHELEAACQQLRALKMSWSWRLTSPLRRLRRLFWPER